MDTQKYIIEKYNLTTKYHGPTEIPNVGRDNLPELFKELGFKEGVEIGVEKGLYSKVLCDKNPDGKLYSIDPWARSEDYFEFRANGKAEKNYQEAKERLKDSNCELMRGLSLDKIKLFDNESLDYVYIDGNHSFPAVVADIYEWTKKVKKGGIIAGHDYRFERFKNGVNRTHHVKHAVWGYTQAYKIKPWFVLGTDAKLEGEIRDKVRSWMWVKQ